MEVINDFGEKIIHKVEGTEVDGWRMGGESRGSMRKEVKGGRREAWD